MKKLLYLSPLPKDSQTGGANAVNFHIFRQLERYYQCDYVEINPPAHKLPRFISKIRRKIFHLPGKFDFYSEQRLNFIKEQFMKIPGTYDFIFFRGFTPWINIKPGIPYFAYNDVHFRQYFENTFSCSDFDRNDLQRIFNKEKEWLAGAAGVFFESEWGLQKCKEHYNSPYTNFCNLNRGGNIPLPGKDTWNGKLSLVLVANNFRQKGGDVAFQAFKDLYNENGNYSFNIVGGFPEKEVVRHPGVKYHGYLHKENIAEIVTLTKILSEAFLLLHLTREDTNPLVITEAGYYGCPCISVNKFAIPHMVRQDETGILLQFPPDPEEISNKVRELELNRDYYLEMRKRTFAFNHQNFSWEKIGESARDFIDGTLNSSHQRKQ